MEDGSGRERYVPQSLAFYLILQKTAKRTGSKIRKLRFKDTGLKFKDSDCTFEKQLAPGAAVFQNYRR